MLALFSCSFFHNEQCGNIGTSSRSTKLVHGGVRYLQKAIMELDYEQYKLVVEALHERKIFIDNAPYLAGELPIMLPVYK
jgi:glycerol-3-phosphate dehydrogenase